jgi:hypothetical protein
MREYLLVFQENSDELVDHPSVLVPVINDFLEKNIGSGITAFETLTRKKKNFPKQFKDVIGYYLGNVMTNVWKYMKDYVDHEFVEKAFHINRFSYEVLNEQHKDYHIKFGTDVTTHSAHNAFMLAKELSYRTSVIGWVDAWLYYYKKSKPDSNDMKEYFLAANMYFEMYKEDSNNANALIQANEVIKKVVRKELKNIELISGDYNAELWLKTHIDLLMDTQEVLAKVENDPEYLNNNYEVADYASDYIKDSNLRIQLRERSFHFYDKYYKTTSLLN